MSSFIAPTNHLLTNHQVFGIDSFLPSSAAVTPCGVFFSGSLRKAPPDAAALLQERLSCELSRTPSVAPHLTALT